jgi:hypothetical protein
MGAGTPGHRDLSGVTAIGVDEIAWRKGHNYLTMVYQIDAGWEPTHAANDPQILLRRQKYQAF